MGNLPKNEEKKLKKKLWLWKPVLFTIAIGVIVFIIISNSIYTNNHLYVLRSNQPITKVEMKVVSEAGVNNILLTDSKQLDSVNNAFKTAQEKKFQEGGSYELWADVNVYKSNKKINLFIQHSLYNGWMIDVGNTTLTSDYLFDLVRRYSR